MSKVEQLPDKLLQRSNEWLDANGLDSDSVRWGAFPVGMVQSWIERAEKAEREMKTLRTILWRGDIESEPPPER